MALAGGGRTLVVNLVADTKGFGADINRARQQVGGFRGAISKLGAMAGPALAGAAAAAGALAVKFGIDGVKAAAEEEQAVRQLTKVLENNGFPGATEDVESFISSQQRAMGVSDNELRPAFQRLFLATKDVGAAQTATSLAMDIAAATGKPLETVANALGKAYEGNTGALGRLGLGLDKATLSSGDLSGITQILSDKFGGSASANAETYKGKIARLSEGFGELQESFGAGFLDGLAGADEATGNLTTSMSELEAPMRDVGEQLGEVTTKVADLTPLVVDLYKGWDTLINMKGTPEWANVIITSIRPIIAPLQTIVDLVGTAKSGLVALGLMDDTGGPSKTPANVPPSNYYDTYGDGRPNNQYTGKPIPARTRSGFSKGAPTDGVVININTGLGDPVAIAREVERVLRLQDTRLGPS